MPRYRFHDLVISSGIELPELVESERADGPVCDVRFHVVAEKDRHTAADGADSDIDPVTTVSVEGTLVSFASGVDFTIAASADTVVVRHLVDVDLATMRHLLLDHALPRLVADRGHFVAHASGVDFCGQALVFLGQSGHGKSSLAASLHRVGHSLLGDDCLVLTTVGDGTVHAMSTYRSLRLLPESLEEFYNSTPTEELTSMGVGYSKVRVPEQGGAEARPLPVTAIFVLDEPGHIGPPRTERLTRRDAMVELAKNSFRLDATGAAALGSALDQAQEIVETVPVFRLSYERDFRALSALHQTIFEVVGDPA